MKSLLPFSIENRRTPGKEKRGLGRRQKKSPGGSSELLRGVHGEWRGQKRYSTIVGVTKITSSCFLSAMELDEKSLPRNGTSLRNGTPRFTLV
jgi:hypothetical protein